MYLFSAGDEAAYAAAVSYYYLFVCSFVTLCYLIYILERKITVQVQKPV